MNRVGFQQITEVRLKEAKSLLVAGFAEGAYYLGGYVVECALKACIAKQTREHDFPDKNASKYYSHDLKTLLLFAELKEEFEADWQTIPFLKENWIIVQDWSEQSRYEQKTIQDATDLLRAIEDRTGGLLTWLQKRW